jgi:hypothetical protein
MTNDSENAADLYRVTKVLDVENICLNVNSAAIDRKRLDKCNDELWRFYRRLKQVDSHYL